MPARKPTSLTTRHATKEEIRARVSAETALTPRTALSKKPPESLRGHKRARETWTRLVGLWQETEGTIVTAFDTDLLIKYCLAEEELDELYKLRADIKKLWDQHAKLLAKMKPQAEDLKDYYNALGQANALLQRFQGMDARLDGKRKMVFALAQSLYLTPRSRAGVAPPEKPAEEPLDELDKLLDGG